MNLSTVVSKIDMHQYLTARDFLKDIDLICSNALKYNPNKGPAGEGIFFTPNLEKFLTYKLIDFVCGNLVIPQWIWDQIFLNHPIR